MSNVIRVEEMQDEPGMYQKALAQQYDEWRRSTEGYDRGTNGFAIASLVLGLLWFGGVGSLLAIVFAVHGHRQITWSGDRQAGWAMASWGLALGILGVIGAVILWAVIISAAVHTGSQVDQLQQQCVPGVTC